MFVVNGLWDHSVKCTLKSTRKLYEKGGLIGHSNIMQTFSKYASMYNHELP